MARKYTVTSRLAIGFGALLLLLIVTVGIAISRIIAIESIANTFIDRDRIKANAISEIDSLTRSNGLAIVELSITKDSTRADDIRRQVDANKLKITEDLELLQKIADTVKGRELLSEISILRKTYVTSFSKVDDMIVAGNIVGATEKISSETIPALNALQTKIGALKNALTTIIEARAVQTKKIIASAYFMLAIASGIAIGVAVLVAAFIARSILRTLGGEPEYVACIARSVASGDLTMNIQLKKGDEGSLLFYMKEMCFRLSCNIGKVQGGANTIATATTQIASGNLDLSARTEQQASALEETAASMEQLSSTVKQNAENARRANMLANSASDVAIRGGNVVAQVVDTMGSINDSAKKIVDIIDVIDGIAFQTNILALNAAVEAARAGEQGRGFAVVASEVRSLAQRSAGAAKEIKLLIDDSVDKVDAGTKLVDQAGATMGEIVSSVRSVTDIMGEIQTASMEQESGLQQINQAITEMDSVTQQNAVLVEQAADAATSLEEQAGSLMGVVNVFKLDRVHAQRGLAITESKSLTTLNVQALGMQQPMIAVS